MTTERQLDAQRVCPTWTDHDWRVTLAETGRHETRGNFQRFNRTCRTCGKVASETRWIETPALTAIGHQLKREEQE